MRGGRFLCLRAGERERVGDAGLTDALTDGFRKTFFCLEAPLKNEMQRRRAPFFFLLALRRILDLEEMVVGEYGSVGIDMKLDGGGVTFRRNAATSSQASSSPSEVRLRSPAAPRVKGRDWGRAGASLRGSSSSLDSTRMSIRRRIPPGQFEPSAVAGVS